MNDMTGVVRPQYPKVVIVEDDPSVRRSLQLLVQGQGFEVRTFASAEALLSAPILQSPDFQVPDCLVIDYLLDGVDGIALLPALRTRGWKGPAILITGHPSAEVSQRAQDKGFVLVFEKPLRERSLLEALKRLAPPPSE